MRNLKKILALVLALVMTMSVMSFASAAKAGTDYSDDASITQFDESIQVLTALGIYRGDEEGFRPNSTITRAEAAALVYRIISKDVTDTQTGIYADYNKFSDVKSTDWFAGYVNFCANGQYIVGNGDGTFNYAGNITGYELLAIILRSLGYGQNAEYQGTGWEIKTATDARKLGITKNINESTLGQAQTRAAVAEMLFQGLTCTQTVEYTALLGYTSNASTLTGKTTHGTLGYENFGLRGQYLSTNEDDEAEYLISADNNGDGYLLSDLTTRNLAVADTAIEVVEDFDNTDFNTEDDTIQSVIVGNKYGEPVAFWYAKSVVNPVTNPAGEIEIRFNPIATYTVAVREDEVFTAVNGTGRSVTFSEANANEDGEAYNDDGVTVYKTLTDKRTLLDDTTATLGYVGGNGTVTELYIVDGSKYMVLRNTWLDTVSQAYSAKYGTGLELTDGLDTDAPASAEATLADFNVGDHVLFNVYGADRNIDYTTITLAETKTVTLTNSYVREGETNWSTCESSYFLVGSTTYEYDCNTLDNADEYSDLDFNHGDGLLDRNLLLQQDPAEDTQVLYFDEYGYVIFSEAVNTQTTAGYMIVTSTEYGGYDKDNGYYMNIKGYDMDGKSVTVQGGFDQYVYTNKDDASDYSADIAIYKYTKDLDTGFVNLEADVAEDGGADNEILAGDPDAVSGGDVVADNETVFVVANYNTKGAITGYDVYTGIKNIKDLKDAELGDKSSVIYTDYVNWEVTYIDNDIDPENPDNEDYEADNVIDLVLVLGAKQSSDVQYTAKDAQIPDIIYIRTGVPEKQFSEYNLYTAIVDGKLTTVKVDVDAEGQADGDYESIFENGAGFYEVTAWTNGGDYIYGVEAVEAVEATYAGVDVLAMEMDSDAIWKYASCHGGDGESNNGYVVLADNYKMYDITSGEAVEITAEDLIIDETNDYNLNELGYTGVNAVVADWNNYGFATVVYVISADIG